MGNVTASAQLSIKDTIVSVIRKDSVLANVFKPSDFYDFDPNNKSSAVSLPYFVIEIPSLPNEPLVFNNKTKWKELTIPVTMYNDYSAKNKVLGYCNRIINIIELNESDFDDNFFYIKNINLIENVVEIENQKQMISSSFEININISVGY
jgi:hypothetical protein